MASTAGPTAATTAGTVGSQRPRRSTRPLEEPVHGRVVSHRPWTGRFERVRPIPGEPLRTTRGDGMDDVMHSLPFTDTPPRPGMVWVPGGTFMMGSDHHYTEESPAHKVSVDGFWIDRYTVTNRDFATFVRATGHLTVAERAVDPADYPGARPDMLQPSSSVFVKPQRRVDLANPYLWWTY